LVATVCVSAPELALAKIAGTPCGEPGSMITEGLASDERRKQDTNRCPRNGSVRDSEAQHPAGGGSVCS
jgi:hypothetical protein